MYTFSNDTTVTVIEDATFNISSQLSDEENVRTSVLTFFADLTMADVNRFFCVANNTVTSVMSNTSIVTIQSKSNPWLLKIILIIKFNIIDVGIIMLEYVCNYSVYIHVHSRYRCSLEYRHVVYIR